MQTKDLEELMGDTMIKVAEIYEWRVGADKQLCLIPEMKMLLQSVATAQTTMANACQSMADTFKRSEERQEKLEARYADATQLIADARRDQMPLKSHYAILGTILISFVIYVVYQTKTELKASISEISISQQKAVSDLSLGQQKTQQIINQTKEEVVSKVEEVKRK